MRVEPERDRFCLLLHPPGAPPAEAGALVACLEQQRGVRAVDHDAEKGTLTVHLDEREGHVRVLRGIAADHAAAIARARRPRTQALSASVAHSIPGRVRVRLRGASEAMIARIAAALARLPGVQRSRAAAANGSIVVSFDPAVISAEAITAAAIEPLGPAPAPAPAAPGREMQKLVGTALVFGASLTGVVPIPVLLAAVGVTAVPTFRRALANLAKKRVNVDVLDATAIAICIAQADPIAAGAMTTLLALGDLILDRTQDRARKAITELMPLDSGDAFVIDDEGAAPGGRETGRAPVLNARAPRRVSPRELAAGMRIVIYPGTRVPADGVILRGSIAVDEKAITGESLPRERVAGDHVLAASVALSGQAVIEVERAGGDTTAARIVQIIEGAGAKPMTLQENAERTADRLVIPTFAIAGIAYATSGMIDRFASVLITDFGTGVRVAIPTTALASMTLSARRGVLVKGAQYLERLDEVDTIVFDKTGTLTRGVPEVTGVEALGDAFCAREIAAYAAAAEGHQAHPIADAIRRYARSSGAPLWEAESGSEHYRIGLGLEAHVEGRRVLVGSARLLREQGIGCDRGERARDELSARGISSVLVAVDGKLAGVIGYADALREESHRVVRALRDGGRRHVILLSGDARAPVEAIARRCGIDEAIGEVLPHDKAEVVRRLKSRGKKVAMVGDGINDAPALALADVGISLHGGTEVALETADVVLLEGGLERLPEVFALSHQAMRRVREVLGIVLVPNAIAIAAGAVGLINPMIAATLNNGSTIAAALHAASPLLRASKRRR